MENNPVLPKYGILQSLQHMMGAIKRNPVTFGVTLVVSYVISGLTFFLTVLAITSLVLGEFGLLFASYGKILTVFVVGLIIYTLLYALIYAFTMSCIAFSLSSEKYGVGTVLKKALQSTVRVIKVNAWVAIVAYWPIAIAAFLPLLLLGTGGSGLGGPSIAIMTPILLIVALIWALVAQLRYSLAPYVALFEPEVPVKQTLKRSEQLLKKGGQWFVFKGVLLILAIIILLAVVTGSNLRQLENTSDNKINAIFIVLSILIEGTMVMLYLNRSRKQSSENIQKSPQLTIIILLVLFALIGLAALNGKNDNTFSGSLTDDDRDQIAEINASLESKYNDTERKTYIKSIAYALESFYTQNGYYPSEQNIVDSAWTKENLKSLEGKAFIDPNGKRINDQGGDYSYVASPANCTKCSGFELVARLQTGEEYKQTSLNGETKPATESTQSDPANPTAQEVVGTKVGEAYETFRISADGSYAQISPVSHTLSDVTSVEVTINLQCLGSCQFKLVSDTYDFSDTNVYTKSQEIKYTIKTPGEYILYNQYTPNAKFKVSF